jgi:hypothetical protein
MLRRLVDALCDRCDHRVNSPLLDPSRVPTLQTLAVQSRALDRNRAGPIQGDTDSTCTTADTHAPYPFHGSWFRTFF